MPNSYYNHSTYPTPNSPGSSASLRNELNLITDGFALLPTLTGNAYKLATVNSAGTALIASSSVQGLTINSSTILSTTINGSLNTITNISPGSLTSSTVTVGSTSIALGATATTLAGLTSVTSTSFVGTLTGTATNVSGTVAVANGGTGATTALGARTAILPTFSGNSGKIVVVNATATDIEYVTLSGTGTVTSVDVSGGTTGLTTSGGPVLTAGTITLAGTLAVANGGTGQTTYTNGQLLIGNTSTGGLTKATLTAGSNISISNTGGAITIAASGGGTVGSLSVVSANGFAGTVADPTTSPAITLSSTITGLLRSDGTSLLATTIGTGLLFSSGTLSVTGFVQKSGDTMTGDLILAGQSDVRFADADSSAYVGLQAPATVPTSYTLTLPTADGVNGQALVTDGAGALSFVPAGISTGKAIAVAMIFGF
jgi:hypothetical protein